MAATASISIAELQYIANQCYVDQSFEVALINSPGSTFAPSDSLATVTTNEIVEGVGGYERQSITYAGADVGGYTANGIPLVRKAATFAHNGGATSYSFSHVVIIRADTIPSLVAVAPLGSTATLAAGNQAVFYVDATTWRVTG